jgi:hypothetical protein
MVMGNQKSPPSPKMTGIKPRLSRQLLGSTAQLISVSSAYTLYTALLHICALGFISGKRKAIIPWAKVAMDPTAWIDEECYPTGFQWADPSKIQVGQVFHLLEHWRQREESGLIPLIWNPSCGLLADAERHSESIQSRRQSQLNPDSDSEEEDFAAQLGNISENNLESEPPQSPSSSPPWRGLGLPEHDEEEVADVECLAPPAVPHHSCKSGPHICALHSTYPPYIASDGEQSPGVPRTMNAHSDHGMSIINTPEILLIHYV